MTAAPGDLLRVLAPLRRRLRRQRRATDALAIGAGGAAGAAIGLILTRLGTAWTLDPVGVIALGTAMLVAAVRASHHAREPLTPLAAARRAERDPVWRERFTTALEHDDRGGAVPDALRADAVAWAETLDAARTAPWRWPRRPIAVLFAATLVGGVLVVAPERAAWRLGAEATSGAAPTAAAVRDLAHEVAVDARLARDAYLAALATQLEDIAEQAGAGPLDAAARSELDRVLEALAAASSGALTADDLRAELLARTSALDDQAAANPEGVPAPSSSPSTGSASEGRDPSTLGDDVPRTQGGVETEHPEASAGGGSSQEVTTGEGEFDASLLDEVRDASHSEGPPPIGAPGELVGGAQESGAAESRLAGRGSQDLEGANGAVDFADAAAEAAILSGSERDDGRRIEVELPPAEEWEGYDPALFAIGEWRATPESAVTTDPIPLRYLEAAGRYFLPSQETAASR